MRRRHTIGDYDVDTTGFSWRRIIFNLLALVAAWHHSGGLMIPCLMVGNITVEF